MGVSTSSAPLPTWAVTKFRSPSLRDETIARPRLSFILDQAVGSHEPLVLVSAPAGSGKSTAIAQWSRERSDLNVVWVQVEAADNDAVRFWSALTAALAVNHPHIDEVVAPILKAPKAEFVESALPALINALDDIDNTVIVLDDYHLIANERLHIDMAAFLDAAPTNVTLVVSTRMDPPLRLGRLRVRGQLREIRAEDLRFAPAEAAAIFANTTASSAEIEVLCERTEGWAAGLVLAAISLSRVGDPASFVSHFAGDNRLVVDYLSTELWDGLAEGTRNRFLRLSILDKMCGPLVDAVMGTSDRGAEWLETSARDNQLIISLDAHGHWYRYHHLLQDLLRTQLERSQPGEIVGLHARAAQWFAMNNDEQSAIRHALAAGETELAAELIGVHGSHVFSEGQLATVQGWLEVLGEEEVARYPALVTLRAWTMIVDGDYLQVEPVLERAQELLASGVAGSATALLEGSVGAAGALTSIAKGDIGGALETIEAIAADPDRYEITELVTGILGICLTWRGDSERALKLLEAAAQAAPQKGEHLIAVTSTMFLAINACAARDHSRAGYLARQALDYAAEHHLSEYHQIALAHSVLGRTLAVEGSVDAIAHGTRGVTLARRSNEPIMLAVALISHAEILATSESGPAQPLLKEARQLLQRLPDPGIALTFLAVTEARFGSDDKQSSLGSTNQIVEELTERELTILRLLPSRLSVREIAAELYISHNTVKGHVKAVYRKLGVNDRALAVQRAKEMRLL